MAKFKDQCGREWLVVVNVGVIEHARDLAGVNLADLNELAELGADPVKLVKALYATCDPESQGVTPEDFAKAMAGDSLEDAGNALVEAVVDFFPSSRREKIRKLLTLGRGAVETNSKSVDDLLNSQTFTDWLDLKTVGWLEALKTEMEAEIALQQPAQSGLPSATA